MVLGQQPDQLIQIDDQLNNELLYAVLDKRALRKSAQLKHQLAGYDRVLKKSALREHLEQTYLINDSESLKRSRLLAAIQRDEFLCWYLRHRFPEHSDDQNIDLVLAASEQSWQPNTVAAAPSNAPPTHRK